MLSVQMPLSGGRLNYRRSNRAAKLRFADASFVEETSSSYTVSNIVEVPHIRW
jgi:hypothetical protein